MRQSGSVPPARLSRKRYVLPSWLAGRVTEEAYVRWLQRRAIAHVRRDRKRGNRTATVSAYKQAIHAAVESCRGVDAYTGEPLAWELISRYDNDQSKRRKREYKHRFALLPTVDHVGDGKRRADFAICAWRTNDAKHDLTLEEFVALCRRVIRHAETAGG